MTQFLIKIPVEQKLKTEKEVTVVAIGKDKPIEIKEKINLDKFQATDDLLWNTRVYLGYKLINTIEDISLEDMQERIDKYNLDWTILAANDGYKIDKDDNQVTNTLVYYNKAEVLNFISRVRVYLEGVFVREKAPTVVEFGKFQGAINFEDNTDTESEI